MTAGQGGALSTGLLAALALGLIWVAAGSSAAARSTAKTAEMRHETQLNEVLDRRDCRRLVAAAERRYRLPAQLLAALTMAESGRWMTRRQEIVAWPWSVYAQGKGRNFPDRRSAVAAVRSLLAQGVRNIDVGCMQINLRYHPDAFANLDEALDPAANIDYAARLLRRLQQRHRSWSQAVAYYHSATRALNRPYRNKVMRLWHQERRRVDNERRRLVQAAYQRRRAAWRRR